MIKQIIKKLNNVLGESLVEVLIAVLTVALSSVLLVAGISAASKLNNQARIMDEDFVQSSKSAQLREGEGTSGSVSFEVGGDGGTPVEVNYFGTGSLVSYTGEGGGKEDPVEPTVPVHTHPPTPQVRVTVKYYLNDGTSTVFLTQSVLKGEKTLKPSGTPVRENYTFDGSWYRDQACKNKFNFLTDRVEDDMSLYAGWKVNSYTVTFDIQGHGQQPDPQTVKPNEKVTEPPMSETGCVFGGWFTDSACTKKYDFSKVVTGDMTLYAKWTVNKYTVTFDMNGHGTAVPSQTVEHGSLAVRPADPAKDGYFYFGGWYTTSACTTEYNFSTPVTSDITVYAGWSNTQKYAVTFHVNGASGGDIVKYITYNGTVSPLPTVTRSGYDFDGWYTDTSYSTKFTTGTKIKAATDVYAKWTKYVTVTFDATDGTTSTTSKSVLVGGTYGTLPEPVIGDYRKFTGWFTAKSGGTVVTESTTVTNDSNHTLYAHWSDPYVIEFDSILGWQDHKESVVGMNEGQSYTWADYYWTVLSASMNVSYKDGRTMTEGVDYVITKRTEGRLIKTTYFSITFYPGVINGDIYIKASW